MPTSMTNLYLGRYNQTFKSFCPHTTQWGNKHLKIAVKCFTFLNHLCNSIIWQSLTDKTFHAIVTFLKNLNSSHFNPSLWLQYTTYKIWAYIKTQGIIVLPNCKWFQRKLQWWRPHSLNVVRVLLKYFGAIISVCRHFICFLLIFAPFSCPVPEL